MNKITKFAVLIGMILCGTLGVYGQGKMDLPDDGMKKAAGANNGNKHIEIQLDAEPAIFIGGMKLTLGQAIEKAITQNYDLLAVGYEAAMIDTNYQMFLRKFSPALSAEAGGYYVEFPESQVAFAGLNRKGVVADVSIYKKFESGTTVAAGLEHEYYDIKRKQGSTPKESAMLESMYELLGPENAHVPAMFVSIQQELLNNAFGINDRKTDQILKNSMTMQKEAIKFQLSLIVMGVVGEYWTVVMDKVAMENAELQVEDTGRVRDIAAKNVQYGLTTNYTLNMYDAMLAGANAKLAAARQKYNESRRRFLTTINVDSDTVVTDTAVFTDKHPAINVEEGLKTAFEKRADYRNAVLSLENAKLGAKISLNSLLPSLTAEINAKSLGENRNFSESYKEVGRLEYPAMEGKLKVTYPLDNSSLQIQDRNARFRLKQAEIHLEKNKRNIKDNVINSADNIETLYTVYKNAKDAHNKSKLFYYGMLQDLRQGRLSSSIVKNALDALVQSREGELRALVGYNISLLVYDVSRNMLFEKYNIDVEKYIPNDKKK